MWCKGIRIRAAIIQISFITGISAAVALCVVSQPRWAPSDPRCLFVFPGCIPSDSGISTRHIAVKRPRECIYKLSSFALIYFSSDLTIHKINKSMTALSVSHLYELEHHQWNIILHLVTTRSQDFLDGNILDEIISLLQTCMTIFKLTVTPVKSQVCVYGPKSQVCVRWVLQSVQQE